MRDYTIKIIYEQYTSTYSHYNEATSKIWDDKMLYSILQYVNQCFESVSERKHERKKKKIMLVYAFR